MENNHCPTCGQSTTYLLAIDKGTIKIVKAIALFIKGKGYNAVHPRKEMEGKYLTSNEVGNLSRPRFHGLIAKVEGNSGNYLLTRKGVLFLKGEPIPRCAIISKAEGRQIGYTDEDPITISQIDGSYWEGIDYEIHEGQIIKNPKVSEVAQNSQLFK